MPSSGRVVAYDTEFTSWPGFLEQRFQASGRYPEIIQIGAVMLDTDDGFAEIDMFQVLVEPVTNRTLSDYIVELTGVTQIVIDAAGVLFADAMQSFQDFIGMNTAALLAYGTDGAVLTENCALNVLPPPIGLPLEINVRQELMNRGFVTPEVNSSGLPAAFGLNADSPNHDALCDARCLAAVLRALHQKALI